MVIGYGINNDVTLSGKTSSTELEFRIAHQTKIVSSSKRALCYSFTWAYGDTMPNVLDDTVVAHAIDGVRHVLRLNVPQNGCALCRQVYKREDAHAPDRHSAPLASSGMRNANTEDDNLVSWDGASDHQVRIP